MAKSPCRNKRRAIRGFTLLETVISLFIFTVGLLSLATLMGAVALNTDRSRYMRTANLLANEKLEDLTHYSAAATVPPLMPSPADSLTTDESNYFDDIQVAATNGGITEVSFNSDQQKYDVFTHTALLPSGAQTTASDQFASTPPVLANASTFHRRWKVETPVVFTAADGSTVSANVRRVTGLVQLWNPGAQAPLLVQGSQPVTSQLSTIRP